MMNKPKKPKKRPTYKQMYQNSINRLVDMYLERKDRLKRSEEALRDSQNSLVMFEEFLVDFLGYQDFLDILQEREQIRQNRGQ